jgi:hypothetical protein
MRILIAGFPALLAPAVLAGPAGASDDATRAEAVAPNVYAVTSPAPQNRKHIGEPVLRVYLQVEAAAFKYAAIALNTLHENQT